MTQQSQRTRKCRALTGCVRGVQATCCGLLYTRVQLSGPTLSTCVTSLLLAHSYFEVKNQSGGCNLYSVKLWAIEEWQRKLVMDCVNFVSLYIV